MYDKNTIIAHSIYEHECLQTHTNSVTVTFNCSNATWPPCIMRACTCIRFFRTSPAGWNPAFLVPIKPQLWAIFRSSNRPHRHTHTQLQMTITLSKLQLVILHFSIKKKIWELSLRYFRLGVLSAASFALWFYPSLFLFWWLICLHMVGLTYLTFLTSYWLIHVFD